MTIQGLQPPMRERHPLSWDGPALSPFEEFLRERVAQLWDEVWWHQLPWYRRLFYRLQGFRSPIGSPDSAVPWYFLDDDDAR